MLAKYKCWGIQPRNEQQKEALNYLLDIDVDLVILEGIAGSGKTLLGLAAGLELVFNKKQYQEIIFTRAPISVGSDMGHLPGDINEKMQPWCGALIDNMELLISSTDNSSRINKEFADVLINKRVSKYAMMHMRGRSFNNKWVIIDEVQNIAINELKVLLTRAGENCKIICLGDTKQIDNKKLSITNNALSHLIDKSKNCKYIKYVELPVCERSRLASWAANNI